ncbi:MAG: hypothetical protein GY915_00495 [bacterium]|nr:hypothetical protein [bacterium]
MIGYITEENIDKFIETFSRFYKEQILVHIDDSGLLNNKDLPPYRSLSSSKEKLIQIMLFNLLEKMHVKAQEDTIIVVDLLTKLEDEGPLAMSQANEYIKDKIQNSLEPFIKIELGKLFGAGEILVQSYPKSEEEEYLSFSPWPESPLTGIMAKQKADNESSLKEYIEKVKKFKNGVGAEKLIASGGLSEAQRYSLPPSYPEFLYSEASFPTKDIVTDLNIKKGVSTLLDNIEKLINRFGLSGEYGKIKKFNAKFRPGVYTAVKDVVVKEEYIFPDIVTLLPSGTLTSPVKSFVHKVVAVLLLQKMPK